ncbi:MAG TPA: hypothetical protein VM802_16570 [Chitinophaga sp.]|uniref:hypothetical protein n=1 Tax=Chitinophaga sp. TaxID=1869181 RepID=UPI002BD355AE|nr:hypothetical protein [Chitinophaga sp.]HVI46492.1 hypothetical protein [Chitinophaga sp.]
MKPSFFLFIIATLLAVSAIAQKPLTLTPGVIDGFSNPESICQSGSKLYVASINGQGKHGFISEADLTTNKISALHLIPDTVFNSNTPMGLLVVQDMLYVTNYNHVFGIQLKTKQLVFQAAVPGATRLNDLVYRKGMLLVSETNGGNIYEIDLATKAVQPLITNPDDIQKLSGVNGLVLDMKKDVLYATANKDNRSPNSILAIEMKTSKLTVLYQQTLKGSFFDGLTIRHRQLLVTDWAHKIYTLPLFCAPVRSPETLHVKALSNNLDNWDGPPDLIISADDRYYIIPLFQSGKVVIEKIDR